MSVSGEAVASPWRRLAAFALDYVVIALYISLLLALMLTVGRPLIDAIGAPWQAHLMGFAALTLPVILYFALSEHFAGSTLGKHLLSLRVETLAGERLPLGRSLLRSAVKFAPWELAHTAIYHIAGWPQAPEPLTVWQAVAFYLSLGFAAQYVISLFVGRGRTLYDQLAGAQVRAASQEFKALSRY